MKRFMTKEMIKHYLNKGIFTGVYNPTRVDDLDDDAKLLIQMRLKFVANRIMSPIVGENSGEGEYVGQHRFNIIGGNDIGWIPQEDIEALSILEGQNSDEIGKLPIYIYKLTYTSREGIENNFGKVFASQPLIVAREYTVERDHYVLNLSHPQADSIEKAIYTGETEILEWTKIL